MFTRAELIADAKELGATDAQVQELLDAIAQAEQAGIIVTYNDKEVILLTEKGEEWVNGEVAHLFPQLH